jgi:uncharacterized membrane protein
MTTTQRAGRAVPVTERVGVAALVAAAVATGLFAGLIWTFTVAIDPAEARLDGPSYATWRQILVVVLDQGILPVLLLTVLAPAVALVALRRQRRTRSWRWTAATYAVYLVGVVAYTIVLNVPINTTMLGWDPNALPADWTVQRDSWNLLNTIRTPIVIGTFVGYVVALMRLAEERALRTGTGGAGSAP